MLTSNTRGNYCMRLTAIGCLICVSVTKVHQDALVLFGKSVIMLKELVPDPKNSDLSNLNDLNIDKALKYHNNFLYELLLNLRMISDL